MVRERAGRAVECLPAHCSCHCSLLVQSPRDERFAARAQAEKERVIGAEGAVEGDALREGRIDRAAVVGEEDGEPGGWQPAEILRGIADREIAPVDHAREIAGLRVEQQMIAAEVAMEEDGRELCIQRVLEKGGEEAFRPLALRWRHAREECP